MIISNNKNMYYLYVNLEEGVYRNQMNNNEILVIGGIISTTGYPIIIRK